MGWDYKEEKEILDATKKKLEDIGDVVLSEIVEKHEEEYEKYVKYIVVNNLGYDSYMDLENEVNEFIEAAAQEDESFILEGPIQVSTAYLVQVLYNEDRM